MRSGRLLVVLLLLLGLLLPAAGPAQPRVGGAAGLVLAGRVTDGRQLVDLAALGTDELVTAVPWSDGAGRFTGLTLERLLAAVGAAGARLEARDSRGHSIGFAVGDAVARGAFVAHSRDGRPLAAGGPFWIVYPPATAVTAPRALGPPPWPRLTELWIE